MIYVFSKKTLSRQEFLVKKEKLDLSTGLNLFSFTEREPPVIADN